MNSVVRSKATVPKSQMSYIRLGSFSGSALSLLRALEERVDVRDCELSFLPRHPYMVPFAIAARWEARRAGRGIPYTRTAWWSKGIQSALARKGLTAESLPVLFVQTVTACVLDGHQNYFVYTDRTTLEGAAGGGRFASRFTKDWLVRERAFLAGARRIYVMGPSTVTALVRDYGISRDRIRLVGAGPNADTPDPIRRKTCRQFLFVGTQWDLKGGPTLLEAFDQLKRDFPELRLTIVGSHPPPPLPDGVVVAGRVLAAEMGRFYADADALVVPTNSEAFGISILEALMSGLPCVGTHVGNQGWIIGDGGALAAAGDAIDLQRAMRDIITQYSTYQALALSRGMELRGRFTWEHVASAILADILPGSAEIADPVGDASMPA